MGDIETYVGTREAAELAGLAQSHVRLLCNTGRIEGARKAGRDWMVPRSWAETFRRSNKGRTGRVVR